jgi:MFS family permease
MATDEIPVGLRSNLNWRKLWLGQAVSLVGDFIFTTTVVLWIATVIAGDRSWAAVAVSGVLIAAAAPILLVAPFAGVFVDRWNRRRTMMVADLVRAGFVAVMLVVPLFGKNWPIWLQLALVYGLVLLTSATSQFFNPARFAVIASIIAATDRPRAFGLLTASASIAGVIGPPLAAPLLFGTGVHWALVANSASFLISFALVRAIRMPGGGALPAAAKPAFWPEFMAGLRFFIHNRTLVVLVSAVALYMFGVGAINVLDVFFVTENLKVDAGWLGVLGAGFGLGSVLGALIASKVVKAVGEERAFTLGMAVTGLLVVIYSRTTSLPVAIVLLALAGLPLSAVNVVTGPLVLKATPNHLIGRVSTVMNPLIFLASMISMGVAGFLASTALRNLHVVVAGVSFHRIDVIFGVSAILMIVAGLASVRPLTRMAARSGAAVKPDAAAVAEAVT